MNIIPASTISIYKGIPWDISYENVMLFESVNERNTFLQSKLFVNYSELTVIKDGVIRVKGLFNNFLTCNYLSFFNYNFGTTREWFAFITDVVYVNTECVEIHYTLDIWQCYLFDFEIQKCFVIREHVNDDAIGQYTKDEHLDIGEYIVNDVDTWTDSPAVALYALPDTPTYSSVGNVLTCVQSVGANLSDISSISAIIGAYNDYPERIANFIMCVSSMVDNSNHTLQGFIDNINIEINRDFSMGNDVYYPENNKLYTYPYRFLSVDNFGNGLETYKIEDFTSQDFNVRNVTFLIQGTPNPKPIISATPQSYKNSNNIYGFYDQLTNFEVVYDNFPMIPFATDTFKAWLSQYGASFAINSVASLSNDIMDIAGTAGKLAIPDFDFGISDTQNLVKQIGNTAKDVANIYTTVKVNKIHSQQIHNSIGDAGLNFWRDQVGFRFIQYCIKPEYARQIDHYFTRYGYNVSEQKVPNIRGRENFNYVETRNAIITSKNTQTSSIPALHKKIMETCLNKGVTFWHNTNIGIYENNIIVGGS